VGWEYHKTKELGLLVLGGGRKKSISGRFDCIAGAGEGRALENQHFPGNRKKRETPRRGTPWQAACRTNGGAVGGIRALESGNKKGTEKRGVTGKDWTEPRGGGTGVGTGKKGREGARGGVEKNKIFYGAKRGKTPGIARHGGPRSEGSGAGFPSRCGKMIKPEDSTDIGIGVGRGGAAGPLGPCTLTGRASVGNVNWFDPGQSNVEITGAGEEKHIAKWNNKSRWQDATLKGDEPYRVRFAGFVFRECY